MNEDTDYLHTAIINIEPLYDEIESAASFVGVVAEDAEDFYDTMGRLIESTVTPNRDIIPGFSNSEPIEYENVDYREIALMWKYDDYKAEA